MVRFLICINLLAGLATGFSCARVPFKSLRIGVIFAESASPTANRGVVEWLDQREGFEAVPIESSTLRESMSNVDVIWVHLPEPSDYRIIVETDGVLEAISDGYRHGGRFFLTDFAARLPFEAGVEPVEPEVRWIDIEDDWLFDQRGFQSWRGHPSFDGLFGGVFLRDGVEDRRWARIGYFDGQTPSAGRVVGVEKSYITVHGQNILMVEYNEAPGRILCVGAYIGFHEENRADYRQDIFLENALRYLAGSENAVSEQSWPQRDAPPQRVVFASPPLRPASKIQFEYLPQSGPLILSEPATDAFYDLAGRRVLVMGKEAGGIDEVWVHPFRVVKHFRAGIAQDDSVIWLDNIPSAVEIRPESLVRKYSVGHDSLTECIFAAHQKPGAILHYRLKSERPLRLLIVFESDLRWMWPYDESSLGPVLYGFDRGLNAFRSHDRSGAFQSVCGADREPLTHMEGPFSTLHWNGDGFEVEGDTASNILHGALYTIDGTREGTLTYCVVGTDRGETEAISAFRDLMIRPGEAYREQVEYLNHFLDRMTTILTPDEEFNRLWPWSLIATDRFFVETPGVGKGFVAGYATSDKGWDGRHRISGRPGYGWYFGRDAVWSCFAVDGYGDFESVRQQLMFFRKFQDASGKIFHELSTSGVVHYDAADATPLFIILAAHYVRGSGDIRSLRRLWPSLKIALDYLFRTDTDGDGLIENTDTGHGWVEGGALWGAHTTFYLAGLWAQTLYDAAYLASLVDEDSLAAEYELHARQVRAMLNSEFWNESEVFFHYGKLKDGTYNAEQTVLPAVPMGFGLLDDQKAKPVLERFAGNGFTTDWGVRILSEESALFNPRGYHYGSVWPLYTGWTALAEYEYGRSCQGFTHILNNLFIKNHWALGLIEEVMNGVEYRPAGVCPHQCWSETNVIHPAIEGMIGWNPDAMKHTAFLSPRFPIHWDTVEVRNLRVGSMYIHFSMERSNTETRFHLDKTGRGKITLRFAPEFPAGMMIDRITVDQRSVQHPQNVLRGHGSRPLLIRLDRPVDVRIEHCGGVGAVPLMPRPRPGQTSKGYRILAEHLDDGVYRLHLEGRQGTTHPVRIRCFGVGVERVEGARIIRRDDGGMITLHAVFPHSNTPIVRHTVVVHLDGNRSLNVTGRTT